MNEDNKSVEKNNDTALAAPVAARHGLSALGTAEDMKARLMANAGRLRVVHDFIADTFVEGIDYGYADDRSKKKTLLKPGAEKVCKLFNTTPMWEKDADTWEMIGGAAGTVCYICRIVDNSTGLVIGEGRGAEKVGNKLRDANKAIKAAEKCALVDAALYTFNLSDMFTQDMVAPRGELGAEKQELIARVEDLRTGCDSSMTNNQFLHRVARDYLKGPADSVGAVRALRKAIVEDGLYDLATGDRIPE